MKLQMFAIQHVPTGDFLPVPRGRGGRGGSHVEPEPATEVTPPRLFHNRHAAAVALTHWLKGKVTVTSYQHWDGEPDEDWSIEPISTRKREEMAVVPVEMVL